jgi:hypothetical protein
MERTGWGRASSSAFSTRAPIAPGFNANVSEARRYSHASARRGKRCGCGTLGATLALVRKPALSWESSVTIEPGASEPCWSYRLLKDTRGDRVGNVERFRCVRLRSNTAAWTRWTRCQGLQMDSTSRALSRDSGRHLAWFGH